MPRVVGEDVTAIRPSTTDPMPFILTASVLVDSYVALQGLALGLLMEIERWLAAHLMETSARMVASKRIGQTTVTYATGKLGEGLKSTLFGQQVLLLDATGSLANAGTRAAD